ncbi:MAG: F0F1 ATP synthase subunit delta [Chthoniobacterales bacterium]|jgi:F-type H+-transporting ATPase subunit delta
MQIPKEARRKARELFDAALDATGRPDTSKALSIADLLVKSAPRHSLQILKEFTRLIRLESAKHHAVIESAAPVDESTRAAIQKSLEKRDGGTVTLETKVDPSLIGGSRIRLGSEVWDATVVSRLNALAS